MKYFFKYFLDFFKDVNLIPVFGKHCFAKNKFEGMTNKKNIEIRKNGESKSSKSTKTCFFNAGTYTEGFTPLYLMSTWMEPATVTLRITVSLVLLIGFEKRYFSARVTEKGMK